MEKPKNQPEREILGNVENPEIRKISNKKNKNAQNQNYQKILPKEKKVREGYQYQRQRASWLRGGPSTYWPTPGRGSWTGTPWGGAGRGLV